MPAPTQGNTQLSQALQGELADKGFVVAQEGHDLAQVARRRADGELAKDDLMGGDRAAKRTRDHLPQFLEIIHGSDGTPQRSIVPVRRIFFCSSSTP